ncbi:hypothetical protein [Cognatiluteimonas weifangensis]|uniref:hypothetical protein n=1 Tax=Cognatiluteimonas weifangensis TaxID=2303539 RepID=UPI0011C1B8F6|nr:hypothetical protein [Luteimonas weifangensis]
MTRFRRPRVPARGWCRLDRNRSVAADVKLIEVKLSTAQEALVNPPPGKRRKFDQNQAAGKRPELIKIKPAASAVEFASRLILVSTPHGRFMHPAHIRNDPPRKGKMQ